MSTDSFVGPAFEVHTRPDRPVIYEYTTGSCDVWELHHLANHYAWNGGWEPVLAVESHPGVKLPEKVGDDNGPVRNYAALKPYEVLFRRVLKDEEDGDV